MRLRGQIMSRNATVIARRSCKRLDDGRVDRRYEIGRWPPWLFLFRGNKVFASRSQAGWSLAGQRLWKRNLAKIFRMQECLLLLGNKHNDAELMKDNTVVIRQSPMKELFSLVKVLI